MVQGILFFVWLMLLVSSIIAYNIDTVSQGKGQEIAVLLSSKGTVLFRLQDFSLWNPVSSEQTFTEGSVLATGRRSSAIILVEKRVIKVSAFTQISIMARKGSSGDEILVTLLKGSLRALPLPSNSDSLTGAYEKAAKRLTSKGMLSIFGEHESNNAQKLTLKAGKGIVELTGAKDAIHIQRDVNSDVMKVQVLQGKPSLSAALLVTPTSKQADIEDEWNDETEKVELPEGRLSAPSSVPAHKEVGLGLAEVGPGTTYWTTEPFLKGKLPSLSLSVQASDTWKNRDAWFGVVEFDPGEKEKGRYGFKKSMESLLTISSEVILRWGRTKKGDEHKGVLLNIRFGALAPESAGSMRFKKNIDVQSEIPREVPIEMDEKKSEISLASVAHLVEGNVDIHFSNFPERWTEYSKNWFVQRQVLDEKEPQNTLSLLSKEEIIRVAGGLSLLPAFAIQSSKNSIAGNGIFYVRGNKIIAKLHGESGGRKNAGRLGTALNADFAFEGAKGAFVSGPLRGNRRFTSVRKLVKKGEKLFFLTRKGLVGVEGGLLSNFDAMGDLFEQQTIRAVFRQSVQIYE